MEDTDADSELLTSASAQGLEELICSCVSLVIWEEAYRETEQANRVLIDDVCLEEIYCDQREGYQKTPYNLTPPDETNICMTSWYMDGLIPLSLTSERP